MTFCDPSESFVTACIQREQRLATSTTPDRLRPHPLSSGFRAFASVGHADECSDKQTQPLLQRQPPVNSSVCAFTTQYPSNLPAWVDIGKSSKRSAFCSVTKSLLGVPEDCALPTLDEPGTACNEENGCPQRAVRRRRSGK